MRQKRAKVYKRLMALYSMSFGFRQPYQVLVDSTFCEYAVKNKIEIAKQLDAVLQGQAKPSECGYFTNGSDYLKHPWSFAVITQCSMVELHTLGPTQQHVVDVAKGFERRKCNHREAIPNDECIKSVVGKSHSASPSTSCARELPTVA
jgi:U3 small nucleolar RNA-associated protein 23